MTCAGGNSQQGVTLEQFQNVVISNNTSAPTRQWKWALWQHFSRDEDLHAADPFAKYGLDALEPTSATRLLYNAKDYRWEEERVLVKIQPKETRRPFACGAMRESFRAKIQGSKQRAGSGFKVPYFNRLGLGTLTLIVQNFVVKKPRGAPAVLSELKADVEMQSQAERLADAYNATHPPKEVSFLSCFVIRLGDEILHAEGYVPGEYIKHNNNLGAVGHWQASQLAPAEFKDENPEDGNELPTGGQAPSPLPPASDVEQKSHRMTPNAFCHFTFVHTQGEEMVVDIQGALPQPCMNGRWTVMSDPCV